MAEERLSSTVKDNYQKLVKAAINGKTNAMSPLVREAMQGAIASAKSDAQLGHEILSDVQIEIRARKMVLDQLANPEALESAKSQAGASDKESGLGFLVDFISTGSFLSSFMKNFGKRVMGTVSEWISDRSKSPIEIWKQKGQEDVIAAFAANNKLNADRLTKELNQLPAGTNEAAAVTLEQQAAEAEKIAAATKKAQEQAVKDKEENERRLAAGRAVSAGSTQQVKADNKHLANGSTQPAPRTPTTQATAASGATK